MASKIAEIQPTLSADPTFGGIYVDQVAGGIVDLSVTTAGGLGRVLASQLPPGTDVRVHLVRFSFADLNALEERLVADGQALAAKGISIRSLAVDIPTNRVVAGLDGPLASAADALRDRYGDAVVATPAGLLPEPASCTISNCGNPLKGGLAITSANNTVCTLGYFQKISVNIYVATAGHCLADAGGTGTTWVHVSTIGVGSQYQTAPTDAGLITQSDSGAKNQVLEYTIDVRPHYTIASLTGSTAGTSQTVGSFVCKAGARTGWTCGTLTQVNVVSGSLTHLNVVTAPADSGDSGGTIVGPSNRLFGELSLTNRSAIWYVPPDRVNALFGGTPCITSGC